MTNEAICVCGGVIDGIPIHPPVYHETRYELVEGCERPYVWCMHCERECLPGEDFA